MPFDGVSLIGFGKGSAHEEFFAENPATGEVLGPAFYSAHEADVDRAAELARSAFAIYGRLPGSARGAFLREIAAALEARASEIIERAGLEAGLSKARLESEVARTTGQLRLFAEAAEEGSWVNARLDSPDAASKPPKADVRSMLRPLGPVAIFGASNFPLAFSVAGGDTASALAAGNPVIVKAHPAHPGTSDLVGQAIRESVRKCGLPEGVFSLLFDSGINIGVRLVQHPLIKAVGFTGSLAGGKALMKLCANRPEPIPCYAEMGSVNPVFVLPGALQQRGAEIAARLYASFTFGSGQLCTKPGMVLLPKSKEQEAFVHAMRDKVKTATPQVMLTQGIADKYSSAISKRTREAGVTEIAASVATEEPGARSNAVLFATDSASVLKDADLSEEIFGPTTLLVEYTSHENVLEVANKLDGHLTATVHGTEEDLRTHADLIAILENKVGRVIFNGYPTNVEVCHAMVHGGPFPATSDGRTTSVGTMAIFRFARPVCYQGFPEFALADELKRENPLKIWRLVDGQVTK